MRKRNHPLFLVFLSASLWVGSLGLSVQAQQGRLERGGLLGWGKDTIDLYLFKEADNQLVVIDAGENELKPRHPSPSAAFLSRNCVAGTNGGFFTQQFKPLGLMVIQGQRLHPLETGSALVSGVLVDNGKKIFLFRSKNFSSWRKAQAEAPREVLQGGPFLVEKGKMVKGLDDTKVAYRSFIATDEKGNWCLGVTSPLSLKELSQWLVSKPQMKGFAVVTALNLDGGSSSLFWTKKEGLLLAPFKAVRNYLGIAPRSE